MDISIIRGVNMLILSDVLQLDSIHGTSLNHVRWHVLIDRNIASILKCIDRDNFLIDFMINVKLVGPNIRSFNPRNALTSHESPNCSIISIVGLRA